MSTQHNCQIWLKLTVTTRLEFSSAVLQWLFSNACKNAEHLPKRRSKMKLSKSFLHVCLFWSSCIWNSTPELAWSIALSFFGQEPPFLWSRKKWKKRYSNFTEGVFKFDKLSVHLDANQAPISKDATCIISRIEYDPTTDKLEGFALPVDKKFLPSTDSLLCYIVWADWRNLSKWPRSTFSYVNMHGTTYGTWLSTIMFKYNRYKQ